MRRSVSESLTLLTAAVIVCAAVLTATAERDAPLGYRIEGDDVVFSFDPASYDFATHGDTGRRVGLADVAIGPADTVAVAGEFNGWSTDAWPMRMGQGGAYELRRPLSEFTGRNSWAFKFVIDGFFWAEPPNTAPNVVPTGLGNNSHNLLLVLQSPPPPRAAVVDSPPTEWRAAPPPEAVDSPLLERLTPPVETLSGHCSLKPIDGATGPTPIPVTSNPMITSDRWVMSFVSVFVTPPTPEEEASWEAEAEDAGPEGFDKRVGELMEERTANVRAAYVAVYQGVATGAETGVFGLEFIEPLSPERMESLTFEGSGAAVLASDHVAVAVWTDDRDRSCFDAVLTFVRTALDE